MTLLRIEVVSSEGEISITSAERVFKLPGGEHLNFELDRVGDSVTVTLTAAAPGLGRHGEVPQSLEIEMPPVPDSPGRGIYTVIDDVPFFQGRAKK
jgi:hypothetical protein